MKSDMNWTDRFIHTFLYLSYLTIVVCLLLEVVFRILPTSDSLMIKPVNVENPIRRFTENREVSKQIGFNFQHVNIKRINNYGYASDKDFFDKSKQTKPVIAVIGDSYVEALQVKNRHAFHAVLDENIEDYDVYPLGMSGSPLSQYLAFAEYAAETFSPEIYIFLIIENDFDESFQKVKGVPGFHYFDNGTGIKLVDYEPSFLKRLARQSAFLRYLHLDLKLTTQFKIFFKFENSAKKTVNASEFLKLGRIANEKFVQGLTKLPSSSKIIILFDGDRQSIYAGKNKRNMQKPVNVLYDELRMSAVLNSNVEVIDLHNSFKRNWDSNKEKFDYEYDNHWNKLGHSVAAKELSNKIKYGND